jgi:hypothetical protein
MEPDYSNLERKIDETKGFFDPNCGECAKRLEAMEVLYSWGEHMITAHPEMVPYFKLMMFPDLGRMNEALADDAKSS